MASIHPKRFQKGKTQRIAYRLNGKQYSERLPRDLSREAALSILTEFNRRLALHRANVEPFVSPLRQRRSPSTISGFLTWFLDHKKTAFRHGSAISRRTINAYTYAFAVLIESVGDVSVDLNADQIAAFETRLSAYSKNSRSAIVRSLRAAWSFGAGVVGSNPFTSIPVSYDRKIPVVLTVEEKERIAAEITDPVVRLAFSIARYSGLRRGEICRNIRWRDVDLEARILRIPASKATAMDQHVPISGALASELSAAAGDPEAFICPIHPDTMTHAMRSAIRAAGIRKPGAVHILRHSFGYGLLNQNTNIRKIQSMMRHTSGRTTEIYTEIPTDELIDELSEKKL